MRHDLALLLQISAHWSRVFSRVITVTEMLPPPWATVTDWRGASGPQMLALVRAAATLHATPGFSGPGLATGPASFMAPVKGFSGIDRTFQVLKVLVACTCSSGKVPEVRQVWRRSLAKPVVLCASDVPRHYSTSSLCGTRW